MANLEIRGIKELQDSLKDGVTLDHVKKVVRHHGSQLQQRMQRKADFSKGYQTGTTKRSIKLNFDSSNLEARVGPQTHYSPYLEYGTRFMDAQPFVKPAFDEQRDKFLKDMKRLKK